MPRRRRSFRLWLVVASLVMTSFTGLALGSGGGGERTTAETLLREVDASPQKEVARDYVARSRAALDRAARLRSAGDETHARLADSLARAWAEAARDLTRAAATEQSAATLRRDANDAGVIADRERALLEEAIAQSGRLRAQLEAHEREGKEQPARTSTAAVTSEGSKPKPKDKPRATAGDGGAR